MTVFYILQEITLTKFAFFNTVVPATCLDHTSREASVNPTMQISMPTVLLGNYRVRGFWPPVAQQVL